MAARRASAASSHGDRQQSNHDDHDIFDDEYAESYADSTLARTPSVGRRDIDPFADVNSYELTATSSQLPASPTVPHPRRSITKPHREAYALVAQNDPTIISRRRFSTVSSASIAHSDVQEAESNGPSHPYTMYPQGLGLSRSASVATGSTQRGLASTETDRRGPAHEYEMYTQNVFADPSEARGGDAFPVGFPGLNHGYERRIGSDGEEQDIIGPDGHTEQLPPYTRFPDAHNPKIETGTIPLQEGAGSSSAPARSSDPPSPGAEENLTQALHTESAPPTHNSHEYDEKRWRDRSGRERIRYKLWGVLPLWLVILGVSVIVVVAIICGSVIGGFFKNHRPPPPPSTQNALSASTTASVTVTETLLIDASAVSSPTATPTIRAGLYTVSLRTNSSFAQCLTNNTQAAAWSCSLPVSQQQVNLTISPNNYIAIFPTSTPTVLQYGAQIPILPFQKLQLVTDLSAPDRGYAYHFQTTYTKMVIVPPMMLNLAKRAAGTFDSWMMEDIVQRDTVQAGQQPWFCYWNGTMVEGFVYASVNATTSAATSTSSAYVTDSTASVPSATGTSTTSSIASSTVSLAQVQYIPPWITATALPPNAPPAASSWWASRLAASQSGNNVKRRSSAQQTVYGQIPYMVRIVERRVPNGHPAPRCEKMQLLDNGQYNHVVDATGRPICETLQEWEPNPYSKRDAQTDISETCFCGWDNMNN